MNFEMNDAILCRPSPIKILSITSAPLRELVNFLTYRRHSELLPERSRRQPVPALERLPSNISELKEILRPESVLKNRKLFFDCSKREKQRAILIHNRDAQFWIHYFRCGIGLVNLSFFRHLASAEASLENSTRDITHQHEYQWFTHDISANYFADGDCQLQVKKLSDYFIERINPALVNPYSICYETRDFTEAYKFVAGSLEKLKETMIWAYFVCENLKRGREPNGKLWVNPYVTFSCGNLKDPPRVESAAETFIGTIGALAVRENAPFTVLCEGFGRRAGSEGYNWERKKKHFLYFNLEQETRDATAREKIAARAHLINWLKTQDEAGERIIKSWGLRNST